MLPRKRLIWFLALFAVVALTVACGGAAEEPAPTPEEAATPAPEETPEPVIEPEPVPEEPTEPEQPQLQGNIVTSEENFDWIEGGNRTTPSTYYWTVKVNNDTTQNLDITIKFDIVDETDAIVKSESKTIRLAPAGETVVREEAEMSYADALRVAGFQAYVSNWSIVEGAF